ncbi:polymeric immunoglobulin receptor-like [Colossoma macropomum]|uniref:polymeric immunoglobulin receptor-like n=1 Tax=Colossoma macropomum TaxID=42526 RepID=UPI00186525C1|nr:polymeric immunoglobulin receptor-like [Colossoma macropomum]
MKILLIFTLYLISGPVSCFNVIGYPGGSVMIYCDYQLHSKNNRYFCNTNTKQCVYLKSNQTQNTWFHEDRISLCDYPEVLVVIYRQLSLQDAGLYQCGETGVWSHDVNLKVNSDPCCLGSKTVAAYLGETVTISCSYPEQFDMENMKSFFKQNGQYFTEVIRTTETQRGRFSISDNRSSKVLSVRISDVREDDGGVYFCGVTVGGQSVSYYSFYTETHLQVTGKEAPLAPKRPLPASLSTTEKSTATYRTTSAAPTESTSKDEHFSKTYWTISTTLPSVTSEETNAGSSVIITVCVCVTLLLIGGSTLIFYKLRGKIRKEQADYENDLPGKQMSMSPVYQNLEPNNKPSDSAHKSLNPNTNQSDSFYKHLKPNNKQSDLAYKILNPNINPSDSVYQNLNPDTNQPDPVYQNLNPNNN